MARGADVLIEALSDLGADMIVGIPGGETVHVMDAILEKGMRFIPVRHENSAAFMAIMRSRVTGMPGVCLTTIGPGASNIVMGTGTAYLDRVPLLVLSGEFDSKNRSIPHRQVLDQDSLFSSVTKSRLTIGKEDDIRETLGGCFRIMTEEAPGPVHVSLPVGVMGGEHSAHRGLPSPEGPPALPAGASWIGDALLASRRPVIVCGHGTVRSGAGGSLRRFSESWNIPVMHTWMGDGVVPFGSPLCLHRVGLPNDPGVKVLAAADLILTVGMDIPEFHPRIWDACRDVPVVHLSTYPQNVNPTVRSQRIEVCDLVLTLDDLSGSPVPRPSWWGPMRTDIMKRVSPIANGEGRDGIHPVDVISVLRSRLDENDVVVSDVGAHMLWLCRSYPTYRENTLLISNGMIPMGIGLPGSLGVKTALPGRNVVNVSGDGGFQMSVGELGTAVEENIPVVSLIWNDSCLGLIKTRHRMAYGRHFGTGLRSPDFAALAESYGAEGYRASTRDELDEALGNALRSNLPSVIDVRVDPSPNTELFL